MTKIELNIVGFRFKIFSHDKKFNSILEWLKEDFQSCQMNPGADTALSKSMDSCEVHIQEFQSQVGLPVFWRSGLTAFKCPGYTKYIYSAGKVKLKIHFSKCRKIQAWGEDIHELYTTIYLALLSQVVELFEDRGWMPIHAMSGQYKNKNFAVVAPSGFGKSLFTLKNLPPPGASTHNSEFQIFGDEIAFIKGRQIWPLPIRIAISPQAYSAHHFPPVPHRVLYLKGQPHKITIENPNKMSPPLDLHQLIYIQKFGLDWAKLIRQATTSGDCRILAPQKSWRMWWDLASASGVPQMIQYLWRLDFLLRLPWRIFKRLRQITSLT